MTPRKSLTGFFIALALLPAGARADADVKPSGKGERAVAALPASAAQWQPVQTLTQTYFAPKKDYEAMKKKAPSGPLWLWVYEYKDGKPVRKVPSAAALGRTADGKWHVKVNKKAGGQYSLAVVPSVPRKAFPKDMQDAASKKPANVPEDLRNVVVNSGPTSILFG